jgi:signal transduction histidine kinase
MFGKRDADGTVKVLLIEDDEDDYCIVKNKLAEIHSAEYQMEWANTYEIGMASMSQQQHDVYLVDYNLGEHNGLEFLREAVRLDCKAPVIIMTGQGGQAVDVAAIESGAADYLPKGQVTASLLERSIRHSIRNKQAEATIRALNAELEQRVEVRTAQLEVASQNLQHSNEVLKILDRNQQDFIEIAAHELRTPLTVMIGYISMMKANPLVQENKELAELLTGIGKGANRLHEVVNSMLDVRRIDNGTLKIVSEPVALASMIDEIVDQLRAEAGETRKLLFKVECEPELPLLNIDPVQIRKAIHHIVINAIKYTPDGGKITVRTRQVALENGQPGIEISVKDTGIGLDPEHRELIFEKFYQVGSSTLHSSSKMAFKGGGPGLGLAIARGIVQAHHGEIWIESPGCDNVNLPGSTVYLRLPLAVQKDSNGTPLGVSQSH